MYESSLIGYRWESLWLASKLNRSQSGEARDQRLRRLLALQKGVETDQVDGGSGQDEREHAQGRSLRKGEIADPRNGLQPLFSSGKQRGSAYQAKNLSDVRPIVTTKSFSRLPTIYGKRCPVVRMTERAERGILSFQITIMPQPLIERSSRFDPVSGLPIPLLQNLCNLANA